MTAFSTHLDQLLGEPGMRNLGRKILVTLNAAAATCTTTDAEIMKGGASNYDAEQYTGSYLWVPAAATATDAVRTVLSMTVSATVATFTVNRIYTGSDADATAYVLAFDPQILLDLANDVLDDQTFEASVPLYHGPASADMQGSSVDTDWTESNATDTVQTTASEVWAGAQSLVVTDSGSGGGFTDAAVDLPIGQGKQLQLHVIAKADVGTGIFHALDGSNNTQGSIETTSEQWIYGTKQVTYDVADELVGMRIEGDTASAAIDVQFFWFVRLRESLFKLPTWVDERFKVARVEKARFFESASETDTYLANAVDFERLVEREDYRFIGREGDANPASIWVDKQHLAAPLFLVINCPWSAPYGVAATFTGYTASSGIPDRVFMAGWKKRIGGYAPEYFPEAEGRGASELGLRLAPRSNQRPKPKQWGGMRRIG